MGIKNVHGIWLPDHETHLQKFAAEGKYGTWQYQERKRNTALEYVKNFRLAVDVGGHCGLWSKELVRRFEKVVAFEPIAEHRECFVKNVVGNYELMPVALGEEIKRVAMHTTPGSSGDSWVKGEGDIPMTTLDSYAFEDVDFMKLDCEGYELFALRGAEKTIERCHPVVIVEQKPNRPKNFGLHKTGAVKWLTDRGYELKDVISGDYILV